MGSDLNVVNAARVSFDKKSEWEIEQFLDDSGYEIEMNRKHFLSDKDQKLINYLASHGHWSPFAHAFLSVRVKAPIFLARQLVKHQVGLSWNEVSRRYVDSEPEFWFPKVWRGRPVNAKQGSSGEDITPAYQTEHTGYTPTDRLEMICQRALSSYEDFISAGMAPELARMVLPQNTMTEWIWSGSLMAFARIYNQRSDGHAQLEAQQFAEMLQSVIPKEFEHSWKALTK